MRELDNPIARRLGCSRQGVRGISFGVLVAAGKLEEIPCGDLMAVNPPADELRHRILLTATAVQPHHANVDRRLRNHSPRF